MGIFDGILICTDLDGTLLSSDKTISQENKKAIEYFKNEGGYFTFVTGRMPFFVSYVYDAVKPNAPFGCVNGAGLYDGEKNEYVWHASMPENVVELVEYIEKNVPDIGIQPNTFYNTYFYRENKVMEEFRRVTGLENLVCHYRELSDSISKIVFGIETEKEMKLVENLLKSHPLASEFDFVRSEKTLYEILPKGINKGTSISKLCAHLNIDIKNTVAIGDYNNDIPMFKAAGVGVAVSNACKEALDLADVITVSNDENAIAKVIYDIENGKLFK